RHSAGSAGARRSDDPRHARGALRPRRHGGTRPRIRRQGRGHRGPRRPVPRAVAEGIAAKAVRRSDVLPRVTVIVAAHNEEEVIARRVENLLELDYPTELLEIVVASDASTARTQETAREPASREPRVSLLECPRGGKVAAQNLA